MNSLLIFSHWMDKLTEQVGTAVKWLVLVAVLISTGNAIMRKAFSISSNGLLEIQWYLFAAVFLWMIPFDAALSSSRAATRRSSASALFGMKPSEVWPTIIAS